MSTELIVTILGGLVGLGLELLLWERGWLWHSEAGPKRDPRNSPPPY